MVEIEQALHQLGSVVDYPPTPPIAAEVARRLERGEGTAARPARPRRAPARRSRRPRIAVAVGVAALLAAVPILSLGGSGEVQPAAAEALRQVAAVAAAQQPESPPGPGQYFFTRSRGFSVFTTFGAKAWSALLPTEREIWTTPDGRLHLREVSQKPEFASATQRALWVVAGSPPLEPGHVSEESIKGPGFLDTSGLPTEPKALRQLIEARKAPQFRDPPGEAETFVLIGDLLRETYLPPSFRAALYEVAAELPGVELLGEVRDPAGRTGLGVAFSGRETRHELIFDPATSALLAEREVITDPRAEKTLGLAPGSEIESTTYIESGVVDSLRQPAPDRSR